MTRGAYYNELDPKAAAWLRELIADGHIAPGDVDERSILDVTPDDLRGYTQCHWFAGIGGWSAALRLAGWPDDLPVWTGSCPCQPFSEAGGRAGLADERHLWPYWHHLIAQCRPRVVFGEQVEAAIRYGWLDLVRDDLEALDYAFGAAGLPAACVGAPHIRQRLWFVADSYGQRFAQRSEPDRCANQPGQQAPFGHDVGGRGGWGAGIGVGRMADADGGDSGAEREQRSGQFGLLAQGSRPEQLGVAQGDAERTRLPQRLGLPGVPGWALGTGTRQAAVGAGIHADTIGRLGRDPGGRCERLGDQPAHGVAVQTDAATGPLGVEHAEGDRRFERRPESSGRRAVGRRVDSFWDSAIWIDCRDGKRRPVEPGIFPLASGVSGRVGLLRGSGNAIVPQVAAAFIQEYIATRSVI